MNWYNKYRPSSFSEVLGQELVKSVLENSLKQNRIKHGYLLNGPKGVGKTTLARIFASRLNSLDTQPEAVIDIIELDAASNTGIDNIRQLIDSSKTPPINGKHKIYIIDEVHMLSKSAMNALLKTLEEPPEYLVFLLATTNPEKLLPTVLSRLTKLTLQAHSELDLVSNLKRIAEIEGLKIDQESLELIAKRSGGSQRDAINYLETISSYNFEKITVSNTSQILGILPVNILEKTLTSLENNSLNSELVAEIENLGFDGDTFLGQFLEYLIDLGFKNNNQFSSLIPLVAETISLKLPLTSPLTSLAVLQAKLLNSNLNNNSVLPKQNSNISKTSNESKVPDKNNSDLNKVQDADIDTKLVKDATIIKPVLEKKVETLQDISLNTDQNSSQVAQKPNENIEDEPQENDTKEIAKTHSNGELNSIIKSAHKDENAPPILKMLVQNLEIVEALIDKIILSTNNSIFLSQLNNPKIVTFFEEVLFLKTNVKYKIEFILNTKKTSVPEIINYEQEPETSSDMGFADDFVNPYTEQETPIAKTTTAPNSANKIFYQVYKKLPENIDPNLVEVFTGNLEPPENSDDWDNQANNIFEFE